MAEPLTLTVGSIAALAFTNFLESSAVEAAKNLTPVVLSKINTLRQRIWEKLQGNSEVDKLKTTVEKDEKVTKQQIELLTPYLEKVLKEDGDFATEIQQLANEINQEINIGEILGKNVLNVYGGKVVQINDPKAPIFGDVSGGTFTFNTYN